MGMVSGTAKFSPCGRYRYTLTRSWDAAKPEPLVVVMLNPSTADAANDDPTIKRVRGFAESWGWGGILVVNLFAFRSTNPYALREAAERGADPVGPDNDRHLREAQILAKCRGHGVLAAWGAHGALDGRAFRVLHMVDDVPWVCLGLTLGGQPRHPLFVRGDTPLRALAVPR